MEPQIETGYPPKAPWRVGDIEIVPCSEHIGAEVRGVDLNALTDEQFAVLHDAWLKHLVLLFRDQRLSESGQLAFSRRFGDLDLAPKDQNGRPELPDFPEMAVISNVVENGRAIGALGSSEAVWHIDMSYNPIPPKGSALYALEVPPSGGDTGFLSCYAAYDGLPEALKRRAEGVTIKHDATLNSTGQQRTHLEPAHDVRTSAGAVHPAVHIHPETGRRALYLGRRTNGYVTGLSVADSEALLDELWAATTRDDIAWHHQWRVGDLVLWDNRCAMHRRDAFDPGARRVMHRTQIKGTKPCN
ncbi:MAG: TauD/TfdA family dioxygenase [Hyphomicrobiales bacterium]|nr:TauD/TfdA family dioxygenase [Hyphomicrobiales bacterium]